MASLQDQIYTFIIGQFDDFYYPGTVDQDTGSAVDNWFAELFLTPEQFEKMQRIEVDKLSPEDVAGAVWLMGQINAGKIGVVKKEHLVGARFCDGFYLVHGQFILIRAE